MGAPRHPKHKGWPDNLYQQPSGYFYWRNPLEKKNYGLGRDKAFAFTEARAANAVIGNMKKSSLVARISGVEHYTLEKWMDKYIELWPQEGIPKADGTIATAKRFLERIKKSNFAWMPVDAITTKHIHEYLVKVQQESTISVAVNMRTRLQDIFRMAQTAGLIQAGQNPVTATQVKGYEVKRERLSLEQFMDIRAKMPPWGVNGMMLALLTGQRVGDVANMRFADYKEGSLFIVQGKTGHKIQQDGRIRLEAVGMSIDDIVKQCRNRFISKYLLHHTRSSGTYKAGDQVAAHGLSAAFTTARDKCGIVATEGKTPPTFHEIRSLAERLYRSEYGQEFSQSIMGHKHAKQTAEYNDMRGAGWSVVTAK